LTYGKRVGRLIQDAGQNQEIAYIVLQDEQGIVVATPNASNMSLTWNILSSPAPQSGCAQCGFIRCAAAAKNDFAVASGFD